MTLAKCVPEMRKLMGKSFLLFLQENIPDKYLSNQTKASFICYMEKFWLESTWKDTFSHEVLFFLFHLIAVEINCYAQTMSLKDVSNKLMKLS